MDGKTSLSTQEVADILDISKNTVYELIKRGELPSYRVGRKVRVDFQDVEYYKNKSRTGNIAAAPINVQTAQSQQQISSKAIPQYIDLNLMNNKAFIIGGQELLLDVLSRHLATHKNGVTALRNYTGSYNGLVELYKGSVSIASAHLWDSDTDTYNIPYVRRLLPGIPCVILRLVSRMQGFYVAKGNPKKISCWNDIAMANITFINREKGSGVRILIDEHLRKLNIPGNTVKGYDFEVFSHFAAASAVARGEADLAVGNEKTALQVADIEFIPMQKENCDLIIKKEDLNKPSFKAILEILNTKEFQMEIQGIDIYDVSETGQIIGEV